MQAKLSNLVPYPRSQHRRKILGRGEGSGHGQTSTRGMKGQGSRSGDSRMMGFEGGQTPLLRRVPKRGFNNAVFKKSFAIVNLSSLEHYFSAGDEVTPEKLVALGLLKSKDIALKVLGSGVLNKKLIVQAHAVSASARQAIEKIGGKIGILSLP